MITTINNDDPRSISPEPQPIARRCVEFRKVYALCVLGGNLLIAAVGGDAAPPAVSDVRAWQRVGTQLIDIYYDVSDADGDSPLTIYVAVSENGGVSYNVPVFTLSGSAGPGVVPGNDRHVVWDAGADWPGRYNENCRVRIMAEDGTSPPAPANMVYIPGGAFQMGDTFYEGGTDELPIHNVYVSPFFMDRYEVTRELWLSVYTWAIGHGYTFDKPGSAKANGHPIQNVNWYDCIKWCNARSEMEGLTPCYFTTSDRSAVYRTGSTNINNDCVDWTAGGFRLPTEAEWEKAARGGVNGTRYPWGATISYSNANYSGHPTYAGADPDTAPVGSFPATGFGLHDIGGNVIEWCWDWHSQTWYGESGSTMDDCRGPSSSQSHRIQRGGGWNEPSSRLRCAWRTASWPQNDHTSIGFRSVCGL